MLRRIIVSAIVLSLATSSIALARDAEADAAGMTQQMVPVAIFSRLDRDGDGAVSLEEFGGERIEVLRTADADSERFRSSMR